MEDAKVLYPLSPIQTHIMKEFWPTWEWMACNNLSSHLLKLHLPPNIIVFGAALLLPVFLMLVHLQYVIISTHVRSATSNLKELFKLRATQ